MVELDPDFLFLCLEFLHILEDPYGTQGTSFYFDRKQIGRNQFPCQMVEFSQPGLASLQHFQHPDLSDSFRQMPRIFSGRIPQKHPGPFVHKIRPALAVNGQHRIMGIVQDQAIPFQLQFQGLLFLFFIFLYFQPLDSGFHGQKQRIH